ncbi:MAG: RNase J family beta-CASP ribonuclease [Candidatus Paceibacterota bacterium]
MADSSQTPTTNGGGREAGGNSPSGRSRRNHRTSSRRPRPGGAGRRRSHGSPSNDRARTSASQSTSPSRNSAGGGSSSPRQSNTSTATGGGARTYSRSSAGRKRKSQSRQRGGRQQGGRGGQRRGPSSGGRGDAGGKKKDLPVPPIEPRTIRVIPLGGVEEVGRNMMAIEYENDIVVVDAGIQFTDENTPGIDYILANTKYLEDRKDRIRALVVTHGHLDHIGGIPYVMDRLGNPPIYTREFGALLIKKRQEEFPDQPELNITTVGKNDGAIRISDNLKVRFFGLTHSIPDSAGILIETPLGDIVNTGDVRVDNEDGVPSEREVEQYKFFKDRNILFLTMDSTGIEQPGFSVSERTILDNIDKIVARSQGRLLIATFASQVERIIEFIKMAKKYNRKIVVEGRSMKTNVAIIKQLDLVEMDHIIPVDDMNDYPPNQILILATGAQGEEFAALMRIANKTHKYITLTQHDTVVLSSSIIPGNEVAISKLKDNLYRNDSKIITYLDSRVHASGHGKRGELEWIHKQIPYKFFMPVHGHHYMLKMHAEMARQLGTVPENVVVPDNGSVIEIQEDGTKLVKRKEKAPSGDMVVEGFHIGDVQEVVIRDRKLLAEDGMFVIIASINLRTGKLKKSPDIISRGFIYLRESQELLSDARTLIKKSVEKTTKDMNPIDFDLVKQNIDEDVSRFLFQKTAKNPIVIPVVLGI